MRDGHSSGSGRGGPSLLASIRKPNYWLAQAQKKPHYKVGFYFEA